MAHRLHPAEQYVKDVLGGKIVAGRLVRLACERYRRDKKNAKSMGLKFDRARAQHAIDFFQFCKHSKGEWAGQVFELSPWQQFIVWNLFGWVRKDGNRRFRSAYIEVARKNGKTTWLAGIGTYMLDGDGEEGAEVYTAATKREQARIMHADAIAMVRRSAHLSERITVMRDNLSIASTASKYEPLGADAKTLDGLNVHAALVDELHAHPSGDLYQVLETATGARREPLILAITTAGEDQTSFCYALHEHSEKVLEQIIDDETSFAFIAALDDGDDWRDESVWPKSNPNLGVSVSLEYLRERVKDAEQSPRKQNKVRRLLLNEWVQGDIRFFDLARWDKNQGQRLPSEIETANAGRLCYTGLDLSSTTDITASVCVFPPEDTATGVYDVVARFWIPADSLLERERKTRVPYSQWVDEGWILTTPGDVVDYALVRAEINELGKRFRMPEIAFDRWGAERIRQDLEDDGFEMIQFGQGYVSMSSPMKELERLVLQNRLDHGGHPVLRWMANNTTVLTDKTGGNIKPAKPDHHMSHKKIDGIVALVMGLDRAIRNEGDVVDSPSVYEERGVLLF